jgi:hypothetical protein
MRKLVVFVMVLIAAGSLFGAESLFAVGGSVSETQQMAQTETAAQTNSSMVSETNQSDQTVQATVSNKKASYPDYSFITKYNSMSSILETCGLYERAQRTDIVFSFLTLSLISAASTVSYMWASADINDSYQVGSGLLAGSLVTAVPLLFAGGFAVIRTPAEVEASQYLSLLKQKGYNWPSEEREIYAKAAIERVIKSERAFAILGGTLYIAEGMFFFFWALIDDSKYKFKDYYDAGSISFYGNSIQFTRKRAILTKTLSPVYLSLIGAGILYAVLHKGPVQQAYESYLANRDGDGFNRMSFFIEPGLESSSAGIAVAF